MCVLGTRANLTYRGVYLRTKCVYYQQFIDLYKKRDGVDKDGDSRGEGRLEEGKVIRQSHREKGDKLSCIMDP